MRCFDEWFVHATATSTTDEPNAMSLATVSPDGTPSVRMVLLKDVDEARAAFTCYTNLDARKAREAFGAGRAAMCWWWPGQHARQVRVVGRVEHVERDVAAAYFASRPVEAQVGALASQQSRAIANRGELDARVATVDPASATLPESWGGIRVVADEIEFWQGRAGRLHDRIAFLRLNADAAIASSAAVEAAGGETALCEYGTVVKDEHNIDWLRVRLEP